MAAGGIDDIEYWWSLDQPWWLKLTHADRHIRSLDQLLDDYLADEPIYVTSEKAGDEVAHRLHIDRPIPIEMSLVVGDIVNNLRSALDALVYGMVWAEGGVMTRRQERASQFPITITPTAYDQFWKSASSIGTPRLKYALREVQPFRFHEMAQELGVGLDESFESATEYNGLRVLQTLNNTDKHRRLAITAVAADIYYWGSSEGDPEQHWRPGDRSFTHDTIIGWSSGGPADGPNEVVHKFNIVLADVPGNAFYFNSTSLVESVRHYRGDVHTALATMIQCWLMFPTLSAAPTVAASQPAV